MRGLLGVNSQGQVLGQFWDDTVCFCTLNATELRSMELDGWGKHLLPLPANRTVCLEGALPGCGMIDDRQWIVAAQLDIRLTQDLNRSFPGSVDPLAGH